MQLHFALLQHRTALRHVLQHVLCCQLVWRGRYGGLALRYALRAQGLGNAGSMGYVGSGSGSGSGRGTCSSGSGSDGSSSSSCSGNSSSSRIGSACNRSSGSGSGSDSDSDRGSSGGSSRCCSFGGDSGSSSYGYFGGVVGVNCGSGFSGGGGRTAKKKPALNWAQSITSAGSPCPKQEDWRAIATHGSQQRPRNPSALKTHAQGCAAFEQLPHTTQTTLWW